MTPSSVSLVKKRYSYQNKISFLGHAEVSRYYSQNKNKTVCMDLEEILS
jgi:hypothetical protein